MKKYFVYIENRMQNKIIQEKLFKLGYHWGCRNKKFFDEHIGCKYPICIDLNFFNDFGMTYRGRISKEEASEWDNETIEEFKFNRILDIE